MTSETNPNTTQPNPNTSETSNTTESSGPNTTLKTTDPRSPFYLSPPGVLLTNILLRGDSNYDTWSRAMKNAFDAKNKLGFVLGSIHAPSDVISDEGQAWRMCNSMISGWIHNTIDPQLRHFIKYFPTAKQLWDDLKDKYSVANIPRIYQLKSLLPNIKQQGSSISSYYTRLRAIWDELEEHYTSDPCSNGDQCPVTKLLNSIITNDQVYQFLMGLDEATFGIIRSQILNTNPLPSLNRVYSMCKTSF
ncbi:uncharacterized protein LOC133286877 [Gastrolobium bilobum]|uniref:uncharacterized protein LOC133286877 n=1 Tax=Gastrolobium bilobum TaxID=150636 RepID=UPI002AB16F05|nr:uncharacterized protein LOC133286877 [Gastrolobium bilobum]